MNVSRNTPGAWFKELEQRGFIRMTQGHHLGPSGIGQSSRWALEEVPTDNMRTAPKSFMAWRDKQKPRTETVPPRHNGCDTKGNLRVVGG
ncbi:hypothetical protein Z950_2184 [Sulfitobacter mediterraneus KCTC 32188]|nr:hypothetical protein Z950_2184 [Sulfitobacter mediterraneus KCTC 32188]